MSILIKELIGSNTAISPERGLLVYEVILPRLTNTREIIVLDFNGLKLVISAFLNTAIGKLVEHYSVQELYDRLVFIDIEVGTLLLIDKVLLHAERYFKS